MGEAGGDDGDIVLEEVSQIYRCKDCLRCFISFSKFAEHFPVYHPDKVQITEGNQHSAKESPPEKALRSPEQATEVSENTPMNITDDDNQTLVGKFTNNDTVVPKRKKIVIKRNRLLSSISDSSDSSSLSSSDDSREYTLSGKDAACLESCDSPAEAMNDEPESNTATIEEHENVEENVRKKPKKAITSSKNSHDEPSNHQKTSGIMNKSCSVIIVPKQGDKPHEPLEVITLSDSDDDSFSPRASTFSSTVNPCIKVKVEVVDESEPSEKDIAPLQQLNNAPVTNAEDASDNEKTVEDKDTLSSTAPQQKLLCEFCSKPFTRERTLQSHKKSIHRSELDAQEELQKGKDSHLMENCNSEDSQHNISSDKIKTNKRKRKINRKTLDTNVINKSLGFTCIWCPRKFKLLEDLKSHAYNEHIKYKSVV